MFQLASFFWQNLSKIALNIMSKVSIINMISFFLSEWYHWGHSQLFEFAFVTKNLASWNILLLIMLCLCVKLINRVTRGDTFVHKIGTFWLFQDQDGSIGGHAYLATVSHKRDDQRPDRIKHAEKVFKHGQSLKAVDGRVLHGLPQLLPEHQGQVGLRPLRVWWRWPRYRHAW